MVLEQVRYRSIDIYIYTTQQISAMSIELVRISVYLYNTSRPPPWSEQACLIFFSNAFIFWV